MKNALMCTQCVHEVSSEGKFVIFGNATLQLCEKHPGNTIWEVKVADEMEELLKQLTYLDG